MNGIRTDLIYETVLSRRLSCLEGITAKDITYKGINVNTININNIEAAQKTGKKQGKYITVFCSDMQNADASAMDILAECISSQLCTLLPKGCKSVLVAGLGNKAITPDALGPMSVGNIVVSRHIKSNLPEVYNSLNLGNVSAVAPGVLGQTGVESAEIIKGIAQRINPEAVVVIDSLMASKVNRLGATVQLSNTGITPGSGIGNHRREISKDTLGVPVIAMGIPLVIDAKTLVYDCAGADMLEQTNLVVAPKEIDAIVEKCARVLGFSINKAVHSNMKVSEMVSLLA